jgi:protein TonB
MRTEWRRANGSEDRWAKCVLGSGLAHVALLGVCLLIQPAADHAPPPLRVRLVEETSSSTSNRVSAEPQPAPAPVRAVAPSPSKPRRLPPAPIPRAEKRPSIPMQAADALPTPAPATESVSHPTPATHLDLTAPALPPTPAFLSSPAAPATESPPESLAGGGASDAVGSRAAEEGSTIQGTGGGSGSATTSQAAESETRGVFLLTGQGNGAGVGDGAGDGPGRGLGRGSGAGRGEGMGAGLGDGNGTGAIASRGGGTSGGGAGLGDLLRTIRTQIERARVYPDTARRHGMQGTVEVRFRIGPDGSVDAVEIVRSSGHALLDQASTDTVRRAGPYPLVPGWIRVPLAYRLDQ